MKTKKILLLMLVAFLSLQSISQNLLNKPEHVAYDELNNRYLVTNYGNGTIVSIDSAGVQTVVKTGLSACLGIHIIDTNVFISVGSQVKVFGLNSFNTIQTIDLAVTTWLDGMIEDTSGNLYVAENAGRIHKINLSNFSDTIFINSGLPQKPQDLAFDKIHNRLLLACWETNSAITSIDLSTNQISSLIPTTSGQYDGIVLDDSLNIYVSSWLNGGRIYKWTYPYTGGSIIFSQGHAGPAGHALNKEKQMLVVPNFNANSLSYLATNVIINKIQKKSDAINIYNDHLIVNLPGNKTIFVHDITGKLLSTLKINGISNELNLDDLMDQSKAGIYLITIIADEFYKTLKYVTN